MPRCAPSAPAASSSRAVRSRSPTRRRRRAPGPVFELGVPVLGICYGMQTMAQQLGGRVDAGRTREFGYAEVQVAAPCRLLDGMSRP